MQYYNSLNVLQVSDMHLENISISPEELYNQLKDEDIDLIALTGDYLDRKRTLKKLPAYLKVFQQLKPTLGCFAVFGNHDYVLKETHFAHLEKTLNEFGVQTFRNEHTQIVKHGLIINIIGIDDYSTGRSSLSDSYHALDEADYNLVLTHDPNVILEMKDHPFDYLLAGHFHNGQIHWPKPYHLIKMGKLVRMRMVQGLHYMYDKPFYISEGLGQTGLNIRVGSRPEITIHELSLAKKRTQTESAS